MANKPQPTDQPEFDPHALENRPRVAQEIANATGMGAKFIADQLKAADSWEAATDMLLMGEIDEIRELLNPRNKAV